MIPEKTYKIYCLKHPLTNEIRYVGVTTKKSINERLSQHLYKGKFSNGTKISKWIYSLLKNNLKPLIELIEETSYKNWEIREKYWINYYNNLLNQHEGGKGVVIDRSYTSVERSSNAKKIPIIQLDKNGNFIAEYKSAIDAAKKLNLKTVTSISNCLKNYYGANTGYGFYWVYKTDYINKTYNLKSNKSKVNYNNLQKVYLYDKNKNFIKEFNCLNSLVLELSPDKKNYTAAKKAIVKNKTFKGFILSYNKL